MGWRTIAALLTLFAVSARLMSVAAAIASRAPMSLLVQVSNEAASASSVGMSGHHSATARRRAKASRKRPRDPQQINNANPAHLIGGTKPAASASPVAGRAPESTS